jgi:signal transduction histidine kinase
MVGAAMIALSVTGGLTSPLLPILAGPLLLGWTTLRFWPRTHLLHALVPLVVLVALIPASFAAAQFSHVELAVLAAWTTFLVGWMIGLRITRMHEALCAAARRLHQIREGALSDAASRRKGLESMTTKLAHELKNPLAAIRSLTQLELAKVTDDKTKRRLDVMLAETERISAILREYLDRARPVEDVQIEELQLDDLMTEIATLVAGRAEAAGVDLTVSGAGGRLCGDARLLKEALVNITSNAIEATPRGGFVDVTYHLGTAGASITVRDSGKGMSKDVSARVGTPFFTTREGGTGLGVVIAKTAIAQHGGRLDYSSAPGIGTVATVSLPVVPQPGALA